MENEILVPDVIKNRKKLSSEVKENIVNSIFYNIIIFIGMLLITLLLNITFNQFSLNDFELYIKFLQMAMAIITVVFFEIAYRKDTIKIGIHRT